VNGQLKHTELWAECSPMLTSLHLLALGLENNDQETGNEHRNCNSWEKAERSVGLASSAPTSCSNEKEGWGQSRSIPSIWEGSGCCGVGQRPGLDWDLATGTVAPQFWDPARKGRMRPWVSTAVQDSDGMGSGQPSELGWLSGS